MKPGIKTSEFWVTILAPVVMAVLIELGFDQIAAAIAAALPALGYSYSRGQAKAGAK